MLLGYARVSTDGQDLVRDEDVARLSPLGFEHINMLSRYAFTLSDAVARGELRPLCDPAAMGSDADRPALTWVLRSVAPQTPSRLGAGSLPRC